MEQNQAELLQPKYGLNNVQNELSTTFQNFKSEKREWQHSSKLLNT